MKIPVKRLPPGLGLELPTYATAGSAGADLCSAEEIHLAPGQRALISTGLALAIPLGFEGQIRPRSGLAVKQGLTVLNAPGTLDSDYRGEVKVPLINLGHEQIQIRRGMRVAQLIIAPVIRAHFHEVDDLDQTLRGEGGFGSSGNQ